MNQNKMAMAKEVIAIIERNRKPTNTATLPEPRLDTLLAAGRAFLDATPDTLGPNPDPELVQVLTRLVQKSECLVAELKRSR